MATRKKTTDASEAGLSAIEQALGMAGNEGGTGSADAAKPDSTALPKVDDFDIFKPGTMKNPVDTGGSTGPDLTAKRESSPGPLPEASLTGVTPTSDKASAEPVKSEAAIAPQKREPQREIEASRSAGETRRASILPANDDRRAGVSELLEPLRNPAPRTPYLFAILLSAIWLTGAFLMLARPDGLLLAADGALRSGIEGLLLLVGVAVLLPVLFFFALASLQRRTREMRVTSQVMAEVAARLAEPEVAGADTVFTLGQAVRREVSSIGDGIERAVARATELEGLVHGEVTALERSYADNEYKMRALVTGLTAEREAIMATAERIRLTIDAAHQGFSADIEKASSSISSAIDEAGGRVSFLIGGKQDELVATLDRTATHASDLISVRTNDLAEKINAVSRDSAAAIAATGEQIINDLSRVSASTSEALGDQTRTIALELDIASQRSIEAMRTSGDGLVSEINRVSETATGLLADQTRTMALEIDMTSQRSVEAMRISGEGLVNDWRAATDQSVNKIQSIAEEATGAFRSTAESATELFGSAATQSADRITSTVETATAAFRATGDQLKSEIEETATIVNGAFETNSRAILEQIGARAIELNETMQTAGSTFIATIEQRGNDAGRRIEEAGSAVAARIAANAETLAGHSEKIDIRIKDGTDRLEIALREGTNALDEALVLRSGAFEQVLQDRISALDINLGRHAETLADLMTERVGQANEAFSIAGESLGQLITERTREASVGLKSEIDGLGMALTQQSAEATNRLAATGRDVVQAMTAHGVKINEALAANAQKLAETVTSRTAGLGDKFASFEKTFIEKAAAIENTVSTQGDELVQKIGARAENVNANLDQLVSRIETSLDQRAKALNDAIALKTVEFAQSVGAHSNSLLTGLEGQVGLFTSRVVQPLEEQVSALDQRAAKAAEEIAGKLDRSAEAMLLRAGEVQRGLTDLSREVSTEIMNRAELLSRELGEKSETISALFDTKGAAFAEQFESKGMAFTSLFDTRGAAFMAAFETRAGELAERVTASLDELDRAINSGSESSLEGLVTANNRLKGEVSELLGRLGEANGLLNNIVGSATKNLTDVETRMSERVRGLEAMLAGIMTAANQGTDKLVTRVEEIRAASGDVLRYSEGLSVDLDQRANNLQRVASELAGTQEMVTRLINERQDSFESLANTLNARIEDVDSMLRSFTALVEEQLGEAQMKAREASSLVHETAASAAQSIGAQYERLRLESGKERERTAATLRAAYDQANGEMSTLFQRATEGFAATANELRQATREMLDDLEQTRAALASSGLEIPRDVREATSNLKRVVTDQARALNELSEIVSRSNVALDAAEPRRQDSRIAEPRLPDVEPLRVNPVRPTPPRTPPVAPRDPAPRSGSWLSGLLERASDNEPAMGRGLPPQRSANRIESLDSLSVDIARMIDHEAAVELWERYRKGERNVFTRRLYTLQGQEAYDDIRRRYRRDIEFKRTVDAYLDQFERLLAEVAGDDRDNMVARTYLTSDTGKVYTMLAHAAGRFD